MSVDPAEDSVALAGRIGPLPFPLLSDPDRRVIGAYGVADQESEIAVPAVFVVSREGRVLWRHVGETMTDRPTVDQVLEVLRTQR